MGIVVLAALMVEAISVVQYQRAKREMEADLNARSNIVLGSISNDISHALELTEFTMRENLWVIRRNLHNPDSAKVSIVHLIDDNHHVTGGFLAFAPNYYPSIGRLYEPYGQKINGHIELSQIAGPDHDYTKNAEYRKVVETRMPSWSDPYRYGPDSVSLATYSYPVVDAKGHLAAVCGLDIDLSWLGDTLNSRQHFKSSYGLLLTKDGKLVAGPAESRVPAEEVNRVVNVLKGAEPESSLKGIGIRSTQLRHAPYWQLAQVYRTDEVYARIRQMRLQNMVMILLALAILAFMINRYARNEKHLQEATVRQARITGELEAARSIQTEMLPKTFPPFVAGKIEPAREVGGDLFDFFVRDGKLFFCIGDVSGKGVPAAMLMSVIHSLFRMVSQREDSPSSILHTLNAELCRSNDSNMFVTFLVGNLDLYSGVLRFGNAGHDKPFVVGKDISLLPSQANLPLGVFPDTHFQEQTITLDPGTTLLLYTDGLTEAKDPQRQQFGRTRVTEVLKACVSGGNASPGSIVDALRDAAHQFAGDAPQSDDLTLLAIHFAPDDTVREQITLTNDVADVDGLTAFVKDYCARLEMDGKTTAGIRLALEETVVNVMNYAYPEGETGTIHILADSNHREVRFTVIDSGKPFDPTTVLEADTTLDAMNRPIGGLGVLLTRKLMDSVSYCRYDEKNILSLTKTI